MKHTLTLLTALLLARLAAQDAGRNLPGVPMFGNCPTAKSQTLELTEE
jgi:hypothetical protein